MEFTLRRVYARDARQNRKFTASAQRKALNIGDTAIRTARCRDGQHRQGRRGWKLAAL
jgi:hypothetical protein